MLCSSPRTQPASSQCFTTPCSLTPRPEISSTKYRPRLPARPRRSCRSADGCHPSDRTAARPGNPASNSRTADLLPRSRPDWRLFAFRRWVYQCGVDLRRIGVYADGARSGKGTDLEEDARFTAFYRSEFVGQVRRAWLVTGSAEAAHDVVHDAMIEIYRRWDSLDSPGAYLNRAVLNGCHQIDRRTIAQRRLLPRLVDRGPHSATSEVLDDVLDELPFNQRAAVILRYYGGLSTEEIAHALNCAPGSVGPWINRALKKMRKALQ